MWLVTAVDQRACGAARERFGGPAAGVEHECDLSGRVARMFVDVHKSVAQRNIPTHNRGVVASTVAERALVLMSQPPIQFHNSVVCLVPHVVVL